MINTLWPSDAIWRHRPASTLAKVMAWCLMASSHYLNQRYFLISEVLWHSPESNITVRAQVAVNIFHHFMSWKLLFLNYCHISEEPKWCFVSYPEDTYSVHVYEREKHSFDHLYHSMIRRLAMLTILQTDADSSLTTWAYSTDGSKSLAHNGLSRTLLQAITRTNADLLYI